MISYELLSAINKQNSVEVYYIVGIDNDFNVTCSEKFEFEDCHVNSGSMTVLDNDIFILAAKQKGYTYNRDKFIINKHGKNGKLINSYDINTSTDQKYIGDINTDGTYLYALLKIFDDNYQYGDYPFYSEILKLSNSGDVLWAYRTRDSLDITSMKIIGEQLCFVGRKGNTGIFGGSIAIQNSDVKDFSEQPKLYPNPLQVGETLNINLQNFTTGEAKIFDMQGRLVHIEDLRGLGNLGGQCSFNLPENIAAGVYSLVLESNGEIIVSEKFVVE